MKNQNTGTVSVIKDLGRYYDTPVERHIDCGVSIIGTEWLSTIHQATDCGQFDRGDVVPDGYNKSIEAKKIMVGTEFLWVTPASLDAYNTECAACCDDATQLAMPENFNIDSGDTIANLTWDAAANATNYVVERDVDAGFNNPTVVYSGALLLFGDTGLTNDVIYFYRIKAQAPNYTDSKWNGEQAKPTLPALAVPANFTATEGDTQIDLDWDATPSATGYVLERDTDSGFSSPTTVYTGANTDYSDTGLTNGVAYYYRVKAQAAGFNDSDYAVASETPEA